MFKLRHEESVSQVELWGSNCRQAVHGVAKSRTRQSTFTFTFHSHALEKEMAPLSSVLAWRIPGTAEPDGLPSMGSHRVRRDWSDLAATAAAIVGRGQRICKYLDTGKSLAFPRNWKKAVVFLLVPRSIPSPAPGMLASQRPDSASCLGYLPRWLCWTEPTEGAGRRLRRAKGRNQDTSLFSLSQETLSSNDDTFSVAVEGFGFGENMMMSPFLCFRTRIVGWGHSSYSLMVPPCAQVCSCGYNHPVASV